MTQPSIDATYLGVTDLLTVPLHRYGITGIDNAKLAEEILANQTRLSVNRNISRFEDTLFEPEPNSQGHLLLETVTAIVAPDLKIIEQWSQVHHPLESTGLHDHSSLWNRAAFVYYVRVPEGAGDLVFQFEDGSLPAVTPTEGTLLIFPSWCKHKVSKNMSSAIRISVSGNLSPT